MQTSALVQVEATTTPFAELDADLHVPPCPRARAPAEVAGVARARRREGRRTSKLACCAPERPSASWWSAWATRAELDAERPGSLGALAAEGRGAATRRQRIAWELAEPGEVGTADAAAAIVEGTILGSYRFDRFRSADPDEPRAAAARTPRARRRTRTPAGSRPGCAPRASRAEAANRARELQNLPANVVTPTFLAERARRSPSRTSAVSAEILGREEIEAKGMGGLAAVAPGSDEEPQLIVPALLGPGIRRGPGPRRQGGHVRLRRDLDQAVGQACRR